MSEAGSSQPKGKMAFESGREGDELLEIGPFPMWKATKRTRFELLLSGLRPTKAAEMLYMGVL